LFCFADCYIVGGVAIHFLFATSNSFAQQRSAPTLLVEIIINIYPAAQSDAPIKFQECFNIDGSVVNAAQFHLSYFFLSKGMALCAVWKQVLRINFPKKVLQTTL